MIRFFQKKSIVSILAVISIIASTQSAFAALTIGALTVTSDGAITITSTGAATTVTSGTTLTLNSAAASDTTIAGASTTGNIAVGGALTTGTLTLGGSAGTGAITLGSSTGVGQTVNIASGATTGTDTVNIGTGTATTLKAINIGAVGSVAAPTTVHIADTSNTAVQTVTIGSNAAAANVTTIKGGNGSTAITLTPEATTGGIVIGGSMVGGTIAIGNASQTGAITVTSGAISTNGLAVADAALTSGNALSVTGGTGQTTGSILKLGMPTSTTLAGAAVGAKIDLSTNVTATNQSATGASITLPGGVAITNTTGTTAYKGVTVAAGGAMTQGTGGGSLTVNGADITIPGLTGTSATDAVGNGAKITTGAITTNGTQNGVNVAITAVAAGTANGVLITPPVTTLISGATNGINIGDISSSAGTDTAIKFGAGWDTELAPAADGTTIKLDGDGSPTADLFQIGNGDTVATAGADMLQVNSTVSNVSADAVHITPSFTTNVTQKTYNVIDVDAFTATTNDDSAAAGSAFGIVNGLNIGAITESLGTSDQVSSAAMTIGSGWDSTLAGASGSSNNNGTSIKIIAGQGSMTGTGTGGRLTIQAGDGGGTMSGTGGSGERVEIIGGSANGSAANAGGDVRIYGGNRTSSGAFGMVVIGDANNTPTSLNSGTAATDSRESLFVEGRLEIGGNLVSTSAAAGSTWDVLTLPAKTYTITGGTQVTTATGFNVMSLGQSTVTDSTPVTIDQSATLYVNNAPTTGGSVTITNPYAMWVDAGTSRFDGRVAFGKGADVASANNLALGTDGNLFHITGTTQINLLSADKWTAGSVVHLIFDGSVAVTHNTTVSTVFKPILLSGAATFNATANDTLTLIYDGTSWYEVSRTVI